MNKKCYFCPETERLETHHIVPRRHGGEDSDENTVTVCPTCHSKLENLYNRRFYKALGVSKNQTQKRPSCEFCGEPADGQVVVEARTMDTRFCCIGCAPSEDRLTMRLDQ